MYSRKRKFAIAVLAAITLVIYVPKIVFAAEEQTPVLVQIYDTEVGTEAFERLVQYGNGGHSTLGQALADAGVTDAAPGIGLGIGSGGNGYRPSVTLSIWTNEKFDPEAARQAIKNLINTPSNPVTTNGDCAIACDGTYESDSSTTTTVVESITADESTTTTTTPSAQPVVESDSSSQPTTEPVAESNDQSSTPEQPAPQPTQPESSNEPSVLPDTQTTSTTTTVPSLVFSNGYAYEVQPLLSNQIVTNSEIVNGKNKKIISTKKNNKNKKVISTKKTITKKRIAINKKPVTTRK